MLNEGNQIHNFIFSSGSGTVINYGYGSGSGSTSQKVTVPTVPVPVPQHWIQGSGSVSKCHWSGTLTGTDPCDSGSVIPRSGDWYRYRESFYHWKDSENTVIEYNIDLLRPHLGSYHLALIPVIGPILRMKSSHPWPLNNWIKKPSLDHMDEWSYSVGLVDNVRPSE